MNAHHGWKHRITAAALATLGLVSSSLGAGDVVISQVWGKGNSVPANLPQASYVELFNRTANPIDMSGWSVQVALASSSSWSSMTLAATVQPYSYFLVRVSDGSLTVASDAVFAPTTNILGATGGPVGNKVVLRSTVEALDVACPTGDSTIIDMVGFGSSSNCYETSRAQGISTVGNGLTPTRNSGGCIDTDNNASDFAATIPAPRNSTTAQNICLVSGACCELLTGACGVNSSAACLALGRTYMGDGTSCSPSPCPPAGRCCTALAGLCYVTSLAGCNTVISGRWTTGLTCSSSPTVCGFTDYPIQTTACCFADGTCCQIDLRVWTCESMGGTPPGPAGTACQPLGQPYACGAAAPVNDLCAGATALTTNVARFGSTVPALSNDLCQNLCNHASFSTHGVWFTFTPAVSAQYDVSSCGSLFQSELQVLRVANCTLPATWSYVACSSEEGCSAGFPDTGPCGQYSFSFNAKLRGIHMDAGIVYHVLLTGPGSSGGTGGQSGNYKMMVTPSTDAAFGACCNSVTGQCELRSAAGCASSVPSAAYQGDSTTCTPGLCDIGVGACCSHGGCTLRTFTYCSTIAGTFVDGACLPTPCVTGACCSRVGSCLASIQYSVCIINSGTYLGDNATCSGVTCPQPGACCYPSGLCSLNTETACVSPFPLFGTIGVFQGVGVACVADACPQPGTCCDASLACTFVLESLCLSGSTWTSGGACSANACASGVCCRGATCNTTVAQADCLAAGTAGALYNSSSATCNTGGSNTLPCCHADFNKSLTLEVQDIFDFLNAWFAGSRFAITAGDGATGALAVQNIFDFLNAWFAGGC
jgi:hypothetical protein